MSEFNDKNLMKMIKALKQVPQAKVGILGDKNARSKDKLTNAQIGAKHEFGEDGMPIRSFLRFPISTYLQKYLDNSGAFNKDTLSEVIKLGTIKPWVQKIAITAESIVQEAFATGGFGQWKPSHMEDKKVHLTLVETQQLRNSITSRVD